jgi:tetratricopeptide (TPR) repeat protein
MKAESIVFAVAGMCFGIILGWVIAVQQRPAQPPAPVTAAGAGGAEQTAARQAPPLNQAAVDAQLLIFKNDPQNAGAALQLGNLYFDAERYPDAIKWYEESLKLDPKNPDASTDLGISYYYAGQTDRALQQFENSLSIDPQHTKTMLNQGIVLAFGKQDLAAAEAAWKKLVSISPDSPEGQAARRAIEGIAAAGHSTGATGS